MKKYLLDVKEGIREVFVFPREFVLPETKQFIVSIIGPRRAGKSYSMLDFIKKKRIDDEDFVFVNFEEDAVRSEGGRVKKVIEEHVEIYGKEPRYLFLDEIQELRGWEHWVYSLHERKKYFIYITGSSSKLLSKEIATQLRGRAITWPVFTFSFREFLRVKGFDIKKYYSSREEGLVKKILKEYLTNGGFPQIVLDSVNPKVFFRDYLDLVVYRDIVERYGVREPDIVKMLIKFMAESFSSSFSVNRVHALLEATGARVGKRTLYAYSSYIQDSLFAFFLKKFSFSARETELSIPKVYVCDPGVPNYLLSVRSGENLGRLMENAVFLELKKSELKGLFSGVFYAKNGGKEVDFVVTEGNRVSEAIQVTYAEEWKDVREREWQSLLLIKKKISPEKLTVITWDYEDKKELNYRGNAGEIRFVPLWKWLLGNGESL